MARQLEPEEQEAIEYLEKQIAELARIRKSPEQANANSPEFIGWKSHTTDLLRHYIPSTSEHLRRFSGLSFRTNRIALDFSGSRGDYGIRRDDLERFANDADIAVVCLNGAIERIRAFGISREEPASTKRPVRSRSGFTQHNYGPVHQAVAVDRATQTVGHIGSSGNTLAEISELLKQSYDLTKRDLETGLQVVSQIDVEVQKPEAQRNWRSIAEWGNTFLGLAGKATDLSEKLAPHLTWIKHLLEQAHRHG